MYVYGNLSMLCLKHENIYARFIIILKDAICMPVYFDQICLHLNFKPYLSSKPIHINMRNCQIQLIMHVQILQKNTLFKKCGPNI